MLDGMRWLQTFPHGVHLLGRRMTPRVVLVCCMAVVVLALAPRASAQSGDGWFDDRGEEPTYWSGKGPEQDSPYATDESAPGADEDAPGDPAEEQAQNQRAVEEFSPRLAPYGVWVDDSLYGRVWVPNARYVGSSFAPYVSGGHWELTVDDDWLWVSDYPFGWVTFHYGHWVWLGTSRWAWVPGHRWAPAWVDFRVASPGVAYVGWGPSPPRYVWRNGLFVSFGTAVSVPYVFCPSASVFSVSVNRYIVRDRYRVRELSRDTRLYRTRRVYGTTYVRAPSWRDARIAERDLPRRRVIGRPQSVSQREVYTRRSVSAPGERRSRPSPTSTFESTLAHGSKRGSWNITRATRGSSTVVSAGGSASGWNPIAFQRERTSSTSSASAASK